MWRAHVEIYADSPLVDNENPVGKTKSRLGEKANHVDN